VKGETEMPKARKTTLIYLDEDVRLRLKYLALDERVSMAELIRRAIDDYLKRHGKARKAVRS
jgi:predicted transcriptional regulator